MLRLEQALTQMVGFFMVDESGVLSVLSPIRVCHGLRAERTTCACRTSTCAQPADNAVLRCFVRFIWQECTSQDIFAWPINQDDSSQPQSQHKQRDICCHTQAREQNNNVTTRSEATFSISALDLPPWVANPSETAGDNSNSPFST